MDQIVVLDQGRICEQGNHDSLMKRQGLYFQMYTGQSGFTISPDGNYAEVTAQRLASIPLFSKLLEQDLKILASQFISVRWDAGHTILIEGELGDNFYIIVRGKVAVSVLGSDQQPNQLNCLQDGDYFGELALIEECRRTATVRTLHPSLFLSLERKHFHNMMTNHPAVREAIEREALNRRKELDAFHGMGGEGHT
jgi:ATP-binding cassette subfamily B protein